MTQLRVAIVGSGPSGLYVAKYLLECKGIAIDIFDKLCTPFGLVRYGVAPDHQEAKNVTATFDAVLSHERVRFLGNVEYGKQLHLEEMKRKYSGIVFAAGLFYPSGYLY